MAGTKKTGARRRVPPALVGRWFHSLDVHGCVVWQGQVLHRVASDCYLVQLYEWMIGTANVQRLVRVQDMHGWLFYDTNHAMVDHYESSLQYRRAPTQDEKDVPVQ